jgi:hypothetical protein
MKTVVVVALLGTLVATSGQAGEFLQTLKDGSWLCDTPESYDLAIAEAAKQNGDLDALKKRLLDEKLCIYLDADLVARMMVPYAKVLERQGSKVKVTFTVQQRKRLETLHRQISRFTFVGWTDAGNLLNKEIL